MDIWDVLMRNRKKSFIKRIMKPQEYPVLQNPDGSVSTHSMAWGESDGKYVVYPTVLTTPEGTLERYDPSEAWKRTQANGNYIVFDTPEEAEWFSKHYKDVWGREE